MSASMGLVRVPLGGGSAKHDNRMDELTSRLRRSQEAVNECSRDYGAISVARGHLIPVEMLSGRAGETGELLRSALAREERLARELEAVKRQSALALEREQQSAYVRLRQQEIHATLLAAAHDEADATGAAVQRENALLRQKAEALSSRVKELMARSQEDEQLMRWDLELARRERDAARAHLEQAMLSRRDGIIARLRAAEGDGDAEEAPRPGRDAPVASPPRRGWDFGELLPEGGELKMLKAGVRKLSETLARGPVLDDEEFRHRFREQLTRIEAVLDDVASRTLREQSAE